MTEYLILCSLDRDRLRPIYPALQIQYEDDLLTLGEIRTSDSPTRSRVTILTELSKLDDLQFSVTKYKRNVRQDYLNLKMEAADYKKC
jgi:hypothetical protein